MSTTYQPGTYQPGSGAPEASLLARIDRLPECRYMFKLVGRIAAGGWFEFYELFMPGFISLGLIKSGIFTAHAKGLLDTHSFASFLASFFLGMFLSTAAFGFISDRFGRRIVFTYSMILYSAAQFLVALLHDPGLIDLVRIVAGFAVGMQLVNNDSFISELTPRHSRGRYFTIAYVFILTSVPFAAFASALLVPHDIFGAAGWRYVVAIGAAGGILVWFLQRGLPESPRWLEVHGKQREAERVVSAMEAAVQAEIGRPLPAPDLTEPDASPGTGQWTEMFSSFYLPRTIVISLFQLSQTFAVFGFTSFIPILLVKQGFNIVHSLDYTFMIVLLTPVGALCGAIFAERIQRKWQLVLAALLIACAGAVFANARDVPLILITGGLIAVGNNWLTSIFHPYAAELFPTRIRARAVGFTFSWSRISGIFVGYAVSTLLEAFGPTAVFILIGTAMATIIIAIGVFGPRTNGISLEKLSP